jgi:multiple sugar transport system substrate-binding protein
MKRTLSSLVLLLGLCLSLFVLESFSQPKGEMDFPSWQWGQPGYEDFFREAIKEFQASHPNVTIKEVPVPQAKYDDHHIVRFSAQNPAEIMQWTLFDYHTFAKAGWLVPLNDRLAKTDIPATWNPAFYSFTEVEGKQYGVMLSGSAQMLYVNKKMFARAGAKIPKTPEELVAAAKKLTVRNSSGQVVQYGFSTVSASVPELNNYGLSRFYSGMGGGLTDSNGRPKANSPEVRKSILMMKEMLATGAIPPGLGRIEARQFFWEGKAAMLMEGPWVMTSIKTINPTLLPDVELAPIPFKYQIADASNGLSISKGQKYPELAWEFILQVTSPKWMERYGELTGVIPARKGTLTKKAVQEMPWIDQYAKVAAKGVQQIPKGLEAYQNQVNKAFADRISPVLFENADLDKALENLQQDLLKLGK